MKPVTVHSAARAELDEAMGFYEGRARGLGLDLETNVERAVAGIQRDPEIWPRHKRTAFRKCFVARFPFTVFYMDLSDCIWIVAITHGSRRPDYWSRRKQE